MNRIAAIGGMQVVQWSAIPDIHVRATEECSCARDDGKDNRAYSVENRGVAGLLERAQMALWDGGVGEEEIDAYTKEAISHCYIHLLLTTMTWVCLHWEDPGCAMGEA